MSLKMWSVHFFFSQRTRKGYFTLHFVLVLEGSWGSRKGIRIRIKTRLVMIQMAAKFWGLYTKYLNREFCMQVLIQSLQQFMRLGSSFYAQLTKKLWFTLANLPKVSETTRLSHFNELQQVLFTLLSDEEPWNQGHPKTEFYPLYFTSRELTSDWKLTSWPCRCELIDERPGNTI